MSKISEILIIIAVGTISLILIALFATLWVASECARGISDICS